MSTVESNVREAIENLRHPDWGTRLTAAQALGVYGPAASSAVPALTQRICDVDWMVGIAAVDALSSIGAAADSAVPQLMAVLNALNVHPEVRARAADALAAIGNPVAAPALREAWLNASDGRIRQAAAQALGRFLPK